MLSDLTDPTLAEELRFLHEHIEGLEQRLDTLITSSGAWTDGQEDLAARYAIEPTVRDFMFTFEAKLNTIELRVDGINEELKSIHVLMRQLLKVFDRMTDVIEQANGG